MINLLTLADGFGDNLTGPPWYPEYIKWPEIIKFMTKGVNLTNMARYGAGNEYIINCLKANLLNKDKILIQWAIPNRLDLVLDNNNSIYWEEAISKDLVYSDNILEINNIKFWISSGSINPDVIEYHKKYIGVKQHQLRSLIYIDYARILLETADIDYKFFLNESSTYLKDLPNKNNWIWHDPYMGMHEFRFHSKYSDLDLGVTQPLPLIQFDFIQQYILPSMDLPWRSQNEINAVGNMLYRKYQQYVKNKPLQ